MKQYYLRWILHKVFGNNPLAQFMDIHTDGANWSCALVDKINNQVYVCTFTPIESIKVVAGDNVPNSADELLERNK